MDLIEASDRIVHLFNLKLTGLLDKDDQLELDQFIAQSSENRTAERESEVLLSHEYIKEFDEYDVEKGLQVLQHRLFPGIYPIGKNRMAFPLLKMVAILVFVIGTGVLAYLLLFKEKGANIAGRKNSNYVPAESYEPRLTLVDGSTVVLDTFAANSQLPEQGDALLTKKGNGELVYQADNATKKPNELLYNVLTVPKKRQYKLELSDGTKVWLNAVSSLRYPTKFTGSERTVMLSGEGYFEVADRLENGNKVPFTVKVDDMEVNVVGTHFNINAYGDEPTITTALLEGAVNVTKGPQRVALIAGQEATLVKSSDKLQIQQTDIYHNPAAWIKGEMDFFGSLESMMRIIERMYDVKVTYLDSTKNDLVKFSIVLKSTYTLEFLVEVLNETLNQPSHGNMILTLKGNEVVVSHIR